MKTFRPHKSSFFDLPASVVSIICYLCITLFWTFGLIPVLALFFTEKRSRLVKFHSMQAVLLWAAGYVAGGGITFEAFAALITGESSYMNDTMGWAAPLEILLVRLAVNALVVFLAVIGIVYAYRWQVWRIPVLGHIAQAVAKRCTLPQEDDGTAVGAYAQEISAAPAQDADAPAADYTNTLKMNIIRRFDTDEFEPLPDAGAEKNDALHQDVKADGLLEAENVLASIAAPGQEDPNGQLPEEMRDQPPPERIDDTGCYRELKRAAAQPGKGRRRVRVKRNTGPKPAAGRQGEGQHDISGSAEPYGGTDDAPPETAIVVPIADVRAEGGGADPNRQLPLEMRDPPMPADML